MKLLCSVLSLSVLATAAFLHLSLISAQETSKDVQSAVAFLTNGVDSLPTVGLPGPIVSFGENAFPVVLARYEDENFVPVVSAAFVENGRVLAYGHTDYCSAASISQTDSSKRFFQNAIFWTSGKNNAKPDDVCVAVWKDQTTATFLKDVGFNAFSTGSLDCDFDVLVAGAVALNDDQYDVLFKKIKNGAGFITCGLGWGWSQLNPGKDLIRDHSGNKNFAKHNVALAWTPGYVAPTARGGYEISSESLKNERYADGSNVLDFIQSLSDAGSVDVAREQIRKTSSDDLQQMTSILALESAFLSDKETEVIDKLIDTYSNVVTPSSATPIRESDLLERFVVSIQTQRYLRDQAAGTTKAEDVPAVPAAADFPGSVPEDAQRFENVKVFVKTAVPDWNSTGLYAAPGEVVTVKIDPTILKKTPHPFKVRIGAQKDDIRNLKEWTRYPEITVEKTIKDQETTISNPFGGCVYIVVPRNVGSLGLGQVEFSVSGAVKAPYFIRDVTSLDDWKTIRQNPAPWAELQGRNVIVTVPSRDVRDLDNPQELLEVWDQILDLEAEFAGGPYVRERPERITCDREISAGYMHSGYPVMTHMDVEKDLVDVNHLRQEGDWGFYHEFGHNHQSEYWTFEGSVEVTVNYFTLYIMEQLNGRRANVAKSDLTDEAQKRMIAKYFKTGARFSDWKNEPFLALTMTIQMRNRFGWEPFLRTVSEYRKAPENELPKNDQEKRDQWVARLSRNSGLNLGPFFSLWGVPISQETLDSIKELPTWIPDEMHEYVK